MILELELTSEKKLKFDCIGACTYYNAENEIRYAFNYLEEGMAEGMTYLTLQNIYIDDKDIKKVRYQFGKGLIGFMDKAVENNLEYTGFLRKKMVLV